MPSRCNASVYKVLQILPAPLAGNSASYTQNEKWGKQEVHSCSLFEKPGPGEVPIGKSFSHFYYVTLDTCKRFHSYWQQNPLTVQMNVFFCPVHSTRNKDCLKKYKVNSRVTSEKAESPIKLALNLLPCYITPRISYKDRMKNV